LFAFIFRLIEYCVRVNRGAVRFKADRAPNFKILITFTNSFFCFCCIFISTEGLAGSTQIYTIGETAVFAVYEPNISREELEDEVQALGIDCSPGFVKKIFQMNRSVGVAYRSWRPLQGFARQASEGCHYKNQRLGIAVFGGGRRSYQKEYLLFGGSQSFEIYFKKIENHENYHGWQDQNSTYLKAVDSLGEDKIIAAETVAEVAAVLELLVDLEDDSLSFLKNQIKVRENQSKSGSFRSQYDNLHKYFSRLLVEIEDGGGLSPFLEIRKLNQLERMNFYGLLALQLWKSDQ